MISLLDMFLMILTELPRMPVNYLDSNLCQSFRQTSAVRERLKTDCLHVFSVPEHPHTEMTEEVNDSINNTYERFDNDMYHRYTVSAF